MGGEHNQAPNIMPDKTMITPLRRHLTCLLALIQSLHCLVLSADSNPVIQEEFVYLQAPFPSCHASTLAEAPDGTLWCAFFGGTAERHPDVEIYLSHKRPGEHWSPPRSIVNGIQSQGDRLPTWNPVLFIPSSNDIRLYYKVGPSPSTWWGMVTTSSNGGHHWTSGTPLGDGLIGPVKNKPITLHGNLMLAGASTEHDGWHVHVERSTDLGQTWHRQANLNAAEDTGKIGAIQPTFLIHPAGKIQMLCRTRSEHGFIAQSWSSDLGKSWSPLRPANLPNNNSGFDAVTLQDGRHLLVYNHTTREQPGMGHKGRGMLNVAISQDGELWEAVQVLEHLDQAGKQFSYPAVIQTRDGRIHMTYTWHRERIKHMVLDPGSLRGVPMPDGHWPEKGPSSLRAFHQSEPERQP